MQRLLASFLAAFVFMIMYAAPASAQATRTWVSGVGDDANPCSRTAPCKTFAGAISKTATNGEINCLDSAGFGGVTITKSITIDCHTEHGGILALNFNGVIINGAGAVVTLRGLVINGAGGTTGNGVRILQAGSVNIDNCIIEGFAGAIGSANGRGVTIETSTANVRITIHNSQLFNNNNIGILSFPTAGNVVLSIDNTTIARGAASGIQIHQLTSAMIDHTQVTDQTGGAGLTMELTSAAATVSNSNFSNNLIGISNGNGGSPAVRLFASTITGNTSSGLQINAGSVTSLGNNIIRGNVGNEVPTSTIATQ